MLVFMLLAFSGRVVAGEVYVRNLLALSSARGAYISEISEISIYRLSMTRVHPLSVPCYTECTIM